MAKHSLRSGGERGFSLLERLVSILTVGFTTVLTVQEDTIARQKAR